MMKTLVSYPKKLIRTILVCYQIMVAVSYNTIIFYLKRLPLIKKIVPASAYKVTDLKNVIAILGSLLKFILSFLSKGLYLFVLIYLPVWAIDQSAPSSVHFSYSMNVFFVLSFICGTLTKGWLLTCDKNKYICIKLMNIASKDYLVSQTILKQFLDFISFSAVLQIYLALFGKPFYTGIAYAFSLVCLHLAGEAFSLFLFDKYKLKLSTSFVYILLILLPSLALAYLPVFLNYDLKLYTVMDHIGFQAAALLLGIIGLRYLFAYSRYQWLVSETVSAEFLINASANVNQVQFTSVQLTEEDLEKTNTEKFAHLSGYPFLNTIFFERHRRILNKPVYIRITIIAVLYLAALVILYLFPEMGFKMANMIPGLLPTFVFIMYLLTSNSERICRAMFKNCDISLLHFGFYRQPKVLLSNFRLRLLWMLKPNLLLGAALSFCIITYAWIAGVHWPLADLVPYLLSVLLLSCFFTVHYLFLYYFFQPYTSDLALKSPAYRMINWLVYGFSYFCFNLNAAPGYFSLFILSVTFIYSIAALLLIYKFAPANFRIKQ